VHRDSGRPPTGSRALTSGESLRVAMAVYGDITHDSRVQREASALAGAGHAVTLFCLAWAGNGASSFDARVRVVAVTPRASDVIPGSASPFHLVHSPSRARRYLSRMAWLGAYARNLRAWGREVTSGSRQFDVWHVHDFAALLAVGLHLGGGMPLVYDVHDLFTETGTGRRLPGTLRQAARVLERRLVGRTAFVIAVNHGIATVIERRCHPREMVVVHNAPPRWDPPDARPDLIRERLGLAASTPVVLYHGLLAPGRGLERLCEAMLEPELGDAHLALLGYGHARDALLEIASEPRYANRIHVLDAVAPDDLLPWVASADVGAMAFPRRTLNLYLSTPNKLFECLAAGTPVVVSDFPLVRQIVLGDPLAPLGRTCDPDDTRDLARAIASVLDLDHDTREDLRGRCLAAARDRWNWESEVAHLVSAYGRLASGIGLVPRPPREPR